MMIGTAGPNDERWVVQTPTGRSVGDHVCWPFRHRSELAAVARAFVEEGLERNERVSYAADGRPRELRHDLDGISDLDDRLDRGQLQLTDIATLPASDPSTDPVDELIQLAMMTRESLDAGFTGLRMVADGTSRVLNPTRRDRFVRYEHLVDRFCLDHAFTGLCALNADALGEAALVELGCVHKLTRGELSPFVLCATRDADAALVGTVDAFSVPHLIKALRRIGVPRLANPAVLDATDLEFVDVQALRELDRYVTRTGATLVLRSPPGFVLRLQEMLGLSAVRVERVDTPEEM